MDARIAHRIMRTGEPDTLDKEQLQLDKLPLTRSPTPEPARAWVRYGDQSIEIDVAITAWTERAIAIRWIGPDDVEHHAWVWSGAVSARRSGRRRHRQGQEDGRVARCYVSNQLAVTPKVVAADTGTTRPCADAQTLSDERPADFER